MISLLAFKFKLRRFSLRAAGMVDLGTHQARLGTRRFGP